MGTKRARTSARRTSTSYSIKNRGNSNFLHHTDSYFGPRYRTCRLAASGNSGRFRTAKKRSGGDCLLQLTIFSKTGVKGLSRFVAIFRIPPMQVLLHISVTAGGGAKRRENFEKRKVEREKKKPSALHENEHNKRHHNQPKMAIAQTRPRPRPRL